MMIPLYLLVLVVGFAGSVLYWLENSFASSLETKAYLSLPHAMWFAVATISTGGFGDVATKTDAGKFVTLFLMTTGVGYMAMPIAVIG